ncbi:MAG: 50S ribosomal protein L25 [Candidatus Shikimatogenerans sp. JK-2022]|nr:50S ribosomal protein L25 [Candidatus Shikimatogenerans bostrichidophilus]
MKKIKVLNRLEKKKKNFIPCVLYKKNLNLPCYINLLEVNKILRYKKYIIKIFLEKFQKYICLIKNIQFNILKNKVLHLDFLIINEKKPFIYYSNIKIKGNSIGISKGALCYIPLKKIKIRTKLKNFKKNFLIDITNLDIGDKIYVKDIKKKYKNIEILHPDDLIIISIRINKKNKEEK